ncbi:sodium channel protein Nach-like [Toxorhynchites rutilus septentrionalis]|uniref:sodium channel protein Nach-like n=1 Tax=Toxorhynchites rutilus septentrionalis TaxID=329112 RepID=UPI002479AB0A|nr:sodium channel protein Nach-like [Toxorhynchites rutilus septentrionalis]
MDRNVHRERCLCPIFSTSPIVMQPDQRNNRHGLSTTEPVEQFVFGFRFLSWFRQHLKELCNATALHGYSQIVRDGYGPLERSLWIVAVSLSSITVTSLLWIAWNMSAQHRVLTVIESTNYPVWNIPFPAVTICNLNKISANRSLEKAKTMIRPDNVSVEQLANQFGLLFQANGLTESDENEYMKLRRTLLLNNLEASQMIVELTPSCSSLLARCLWKGASWGCDELFQTVHSGEGLCCAFNYHGIESSAVNISIESRRLATSDPKIGLSLILDPNSEDYYTTDIATVGFKVLIHSSVDYPDESAEIKILASNTEAFVRILPSETYITSNALEQDIATRHCVNYNEMRLGVFRNYSFVNCMAECRASEIFRRCGCVPHSVPSNGSLPACELRNTKCLLANTQYFHSAMPVAHQTDGTILSLCNCLPSCDSVQYSAEMISNPLNRAYSNNFFTLFKDIELRDHSVLHIYYDDLVSTRFRTDIHQTWLDILSFIGGMLGLFLGFSIITGLEVIYFFTIRLLFDVFVQ